MGFPIFANVGAVHWPIGLVILFLFHQVLLYLVHFVKIIFKNEPYKILKAQKKFQVKDIVRAYGQMIVVNVIDRKGIRRLIN
jgi:hypothetical protein